jgi:hypothetical protein
MKEETKDNWIIEPDGSWTNKTVVDEMEKSGALQRFTDNMNRLEDRILFGESTTPNPTIQYIVSSDPFYSPSKWESFWRKFGFYKSKFSQSAAIKLPNDYISFSDIIVSCDKGISQNDYIRAIKRLAKYYKKVRLHEWGTF